MGLPQELKVGVIPSPLLRITTDIQGYTKLSGIEGRFVHLLLTALNVHYELVTPSDGEWGLLNSNGSWSGLIGMIQRNEADMAINLLSISEERLNVVDFSCPYTVDTTIFVAPAPSLISSHFVYLYPFEESIWIGCVLLLVFMPLMYVLYFSKKNTYGLMLLQMFGFLLRQPLLYKDDTFKSRFFISLWYFFAIIISFCYSAVLLSFSSIPLYQPSLRNFGDLHKSISNGHHKCLIFKASYILNFLLTSEDNKLQTIGTEIKRNGWFYEKEELFEGKLDEKAVLIGPRSIFRIIYELDRKKIISDDSLVLWNIAVAIRKDFCCKKKLNSIISRIGSAGLYEKIRIEDIFVRNSLNNDLKSPSVSPILVKDIYGALLVLALGYILSIFALLGELYLFNNKNKETCILYLSESA